MSNALDRRDFLWTAGAAAATFTILKAGSARTYAANETLNIASIGAGGQAASDIQSVASQNIVALCDVDQDRAAGMFQKFPKATLGDIACHYFDPVFRALKLGAPTSVEASSTRVNAETYPVGSMITFHFPTRGKMAPVKLVWYDGGLRPPRPAAIKQGDEMGTNGLLLIGDDDAVLMSDWNSWRMYPEERAKQYGTPPKKLPRSPGHHQEWIDACKGGPAAGSNFDWAGPMTETVLLGNVALRSQLREDLTKARLEWDPAKLAFTNHEPANHFLRREYRPGWGI